MLDTHSTRSTDLHIVIIHRRLHSRVREYFGADNLYNVATFGRRVSTRKPPRSLQVCIIFHICKVEIHKCTRDSRAWAAFEFAMPSSR